jgi:hypothetical protein
MVMINIDVGSAAVSNAVSVYTFPDSVNLYSHISCLVGDELHVFEPFKSYFIVPLVNGYHFVNPRILF